MSISRPSLALTLMAALALFVMGCATTAASSAVPGILLLVAALSLGVQGCLSSAEEDDQARGTWQGCCVDGSFDHMCFCPEGTACNYGWVESCDPARSAGGIACSSSSSENPCGYTDLEMGADMASDADMGGAWEPCCIDGELSACFCAGDSACSYGEYVRCDPERAPMAACAPAEEQCGYAEADMGADLGD
jgi:hypothetical protein